MLVAYDFEVFSNTPNGDWCCVLVDLLSGEETKIVNDSNAMKAYYESHKDWVWVGYNSRSYDNNILKGILLGIEPRVMNDWLIEKGKKAFELCNDINKVQLYGFDVMYSKILSLKRLEAFMGDDIEETNVPFDTTESLTEDDWKSVLFYCEHDVYETIKVMTKAKQEWDAQWSLVREFNLPISALIKTKAQLTAEILDCEPKNWDDEWELPEPEYESKIKKYKSVYDWFFKKENQQIGMKQENMVEGLSLISAWGGGHAAIPNLVRRMNLMCVDVTLTKSV